jgi:hypothetical protein
MVMSDTAQILENPDGTAVSANPAAAAVPAGKYKPVSRFIEPLDRLSIPVQERTLEIRSKNLKDGGAGRDDQVAAEKLAQKKQYYDDLDRARAEQKAEIELKEKYVNETALDIKDEREYWIGEWANGTAPLKNQYIEYVSADPKERKYEQSMRNIQLAAAARGRDIMELDGGEEWLNEQELLAAGLVGGSADKLEYWRSLGPMDAGEVFRRYDYYKILPYAGTVIEGGLAWKIKRILDAKERGEIVSVEDDRLAQQYLDDMTELTVRGMTIGGHITNGALVTIPFMVEAGVALAATAATAPAGGAGGAAAAGEMAVRRGATAVATAAAKTAVKKSALKWVGGKLAQAGVAGTKATFSRYMLPRVLSGVPKYQLQAGIYLTDKGEAVYKDAQVSPAYALFMTYLDTWIEMTSESLGGTLLEPLSKAPGRMLAKNLPPKFLKQFEAFLKTPAGQMLANASKYGREGMAVEFLEERAGAFMRTALDLDPEKGYSFDQFGRALYGESWNDTLVELGVLSIAGATSLVGSTLVYKTLESIEKTTGKKPDKKTFEGVIDSVDSLNETQKETLLNKVRQKETREEQAAYEEAFSSFAALVQREAKVAGKTTEDIDAELAVWDRVISTWQYRTGISRAQIVNEMAPVVSSNPAMIEAITNDSSAVPGAPVQMAAQDALGQPMNNPNIQLEQEVPVFDLAKMPNLFEGISQTRDIKKRIVELSKNNPIKTSELNVLLNIPESMSKARHLVYANSSKRNDDNRTITQGVLSNATEIFAAAPLVEIEKNNRAQEKPDVDSYYHFFFPAKINNMPVTVKVDAESRNGNLEPKEVTLYEIHKGNPQLAPRGNELALMPAGDTISIRDMLTGIKDNQGNYYIDPETGKPNWSIDISDTDLAQNRGQRRGFYNARNNIIALLKDADRSTFLHESAHFFLEFYLRHLPQELDAVFKFAQVQNKPLNELTDTEYKQLQESFATGFEVYLAEGRAPAPELANAFARFKQWLTEIYESVENLIKQSGLKIELSGDIRQFYADMLTAPEVETTIDESLTYDRDTNLYQDAVKKIAELKKKKKKIRETYGNAARPELAEVERTIRDLETVIHRVQRADMVAEAEAAWAESPLAAVQERKVYIDPESGTYEEQQVIPAAWRTNDPIKGTRIDELADELGMSQNELLAQIARTGSKQAFIDDFLQTKRDEIGRDLADEYKDTPVDEVVGSVTPEIAQILAADGSMPAANIVLTAKDLTHIEAQHGKEIRDAGFQDVRSFVNFVLGNVDDVYNGNKSETFELVNKQLKPWGEVVIGLKFDGTSYNVITALQKKLKRFDGKQSLRDLRAFNPADPKASNPSAERSAQLGRSDYLDFTTKPAESNTGGAYDAALTGVEKELKEAAARLRAQAKKKALSAMQLAVLKESLKLSPESRLAVMRRLLDVVGEGDPIDVLNSVYDRAIEEARTAAAAVLHKKIHEELKLTLPKQGVGKYTHEYNNVFDELRRIQDLTQDEAIEEIERIPQGAEDDVVPDDEVFRRAFLEYTANGIEYADTGNLKFVLNGLRELKHEAAGEKKEQNAGRRQAVTERSQKILAGMRKTKFKGDAKSWTTKLINIYRNGSLGFGANQWSLFNSMFGKEMADEWNMEPQESARDTKAFTDMKEVITKAVAPEILGLGNEAGFYRWLDEHITEEYTLVQRKTDIPGETEIQTFNRMGIIDIYNAVKNERGLDSYNWAYGVEDPKERDANGKRLDVAVQELINKLTPQEKAFGDLLMEKAGEYWDELNEVNIRETGLSMGKVENYWPSTAVKPGAIVNNNLDFEVVRFGFQKARSKGVVVPIPVDAWAKLNNHLMGTHHALEITLKWRDLRQALDRHALRGKVEERYGKEAYKTLLDFVNSMSARGLRDELKSGQGINTVLKNWIKAKVSLNPRIFATQLLSVSNYIENMPIADWSKGFAGGLAGGKKTWDYMFENSPYLKMRYEKGFNEDIKRAIAVGKKIATSKRIDKWLTAFGRWGDMGAIVFGGYPMVKYLTEVKGLSMADAVKQFEQATVRAQQSGLTSSLDKLQMSHNVFANFFSAFSNTPRQYARKIADAAISYYNGDIDRGQFYKIMAIYAVIQPALFGMTTTFMAQLLNGGDDDDEQWKKYRNAVALNILGTYWNPFPIGKDVANYVAKWAIEQKKPWKMINLPLIDDLQTMFRSVKDLEDMTFSDFVNVIGTPVEIGTGLPAKTVDRYLRKPFFGE